MAQFTIDRGLIYAVERQDGARREHAARRSAARRSTSARYPTNGLASQVVGYSTQSRSRTGVEQAENSYLTGVERRPRHDPRHGRRPAEGDDDQGQQPRADDPRRARSGSPQNLLAGKCGAAVVLNPKTGAVDVMASTPGLQPEPDRAAGRLREDPGDEEPVPARAGGAAPQPRDAGPLPAGLDLQDDHRRGRARRRRLQARLDLRRPGLLHRVRQAGQERARPERPRGLRDREPGRGLPALDQRGVLQHRAEARREADARGGEEVRLLLGAAARDAVGRALGLRASTSTASSSTRRPARATRASTRAASPSARTRCSTTPLQMAMVAAAVANNGVEMKPTLIKQVLAPDGSVIKRLHPQVLRQATKPSTAAELKNMMVEVVQAGTGHRRPDPRRRRRGQDRAPPRPARAIPCTTPGSSSSPRPTTRPSPAPSSSRTRTTASAARSRRRSRSS